MTEFEEKHNKAKKHLMAADHMLTTTYPLIQDPKMLLAVVDNISNSLTLLMETILEFDKYYKRIGYYGDSFESKCNIFQQEVAQRYSFDKEFIILMKEIKEVIKSHKSSPVEFSKNGKFVICNENYTIKTISVDELKKNIAKAKLYYNVTSNILKNDRIFN